MLDADRFTLGGRYKSPSPVFSLESGVVVMEYIYTVITNFHNLEGFYRLWLQAAATYVIFGLAVDLAALLYFKE